jgi:hypothetical protein
MGLLDTLTQALGSQQGSAQFGRVPRSSATSRRTRLTTCWQRASLRWYRSHVQSRDLRYDAARREA